MKFFGIFEAKPGEFQVKQIHHPAKESEPLATCSSIEEAREAVPDSKAGKTMWSKIEGAAQRVTLRETWLVR